MEDLVKIKTKVLDRAAYLMCWGSDLLEIEGKYPDNVFTLEVKKSFLEFERQYGFVNYRKFCNMRKKIKRQTRKLSGLPPYYHVGRIKGTPFMELARFVSWEGLPGVPKDETKSDNS